MEVLVLDENFVAVDIVDSFDSLIWADRYFKVGDFEIYTGLNLDMLAVLKTDYYLILAGSEHVMIVEGRGLTTDPEEGNHITFSGRSLESILDRRIVWVQTTLSGNFQDELERLLNENAISPENADRQIPNLRFVVSEDPEVTSLTIDAQFTGDNLLSVVESLCGEKNIGWKITLTDDNHFDFMLYSGVDRSYSQETNPYVIFSPKFDNILSSNYAESKKSKKSVTLVAGEGEGITRRTAVAESEGGAGAGLARRELYTDARDISSNSSGGSTPMSETSNPSGGTTVLIDVAVSGDDELNNEEYTALLIQRGKEDLAENVEETSFEGQVDTTILYKYGEDFFMGDILQIANEYDMETKARVVEYIHAQDLNGEATYPTFAKVD